MSIEKSTWDYNLNEGTFDLICDGCNTLEEIDGDFNDCIKYMKENDWKTVRQGSDWINYCPECKDKKL